MSKISSLKTHIKSRRKEKLYSPWNSLMSNLCWGRYSTELNGQILNFDLISGTRAFTIMNGSSLKHTTTIFHVHLFAWTLLTRLWSTLSFTPPSRHTYVCLFSAVIKSGGLYELYKSLLATRLTPFYLKREQVKSPSCSTLSRLFLSRKWNARLFLKIVRTPTAAVLDTRCNFFRIVQPRKYSCNHARSTRLSAWSFSRSTTSLLTSSLRQTVIYSHGTATHSQKKTEKSIASHRLYKSQPAHHKIILQTVFLSPGSDLYSTTLVSPSNPH